MIIIVLGVPGGFRWPHWTKQPKIIVRFFHEFTHGKKEISIMTKIVLIMLDMDEHTQATTIIQIVKIMNIIDTTWHATHY